MSFPKESRQESCFLSHRILDSDEPSVVICTFILRSGKIRFQQISSSSPEIEVRAVLLLMTVYPNFTRVVADVLSPADDLIAGDRTDSRFTNFALRHS